MPIANPKNAALINDEKMSTYVTDTATSLKYKRKPVLLIMLVMKNEPSSAIVSANTTRMGNISVVATTLDATRYAIGRVPDTSIASICSDTRMLPSSAPMFEPSFPAHINPVISGPSDRTTACDTNDGNHDSAPNEESDGRDCRVKTTPAINDVNAIKNKERYPMIKHWLSISRPSNGGEKAPLMVRPINREISPIF